MTHSAGYDEWLETEEGSTYLIRRFDLFGALWAFCARHHSGQWSRGYRILSTLARHRYKPGLYLQKGLFESKEQRAIYRHLVQHYREKV